MGTDKISRPRKISATDFSHKSRWRGKRYVPLASSTYVIGDAVRAGLGLGVAGVQAPVACQPHLKELDLTNCLRSSVVALHTQTDNRLLYDIGDKQPGLSNLKSSSSPTLHTIFLLPLIDLIPEHQLRVAHHVHQPHHNLQGWHMRHRCKLLCFPPTSTSNLPANVPTSRRRSRTRSQQSPTQAMSISTLKTVCLIVTLHPTD